MFPVKESHPSRGRIPRLVKGACITQSRHWNYSKLMVLEVASKSNLMSAKTLSAANSAQRVVEWKFSTFWQLWEERGLSASLVTFDTFANSLSPYHTFILIMRGPSYSFDSQKCTLILVDPAGFNALKSQLKSHPAMACKSLAVVWWLTPLEDPGGGSLLAKAP